MNRRHFMQNAAIAGLFAPTFADAKPATSVAHSVGPNRMGLSAHYDLSIERVLHGSNPAYTPEFLLADITASGGRRFTNFSGDLSGRYVGALSTVARFRKVDAPELDGLVAKIISLQHSEGYFGAPFNFHDPNDQDLALLWGNGRLLIGLLEYCEYRNSQAALAAAISLGNFMVGIGPLMNSEAMRARFDANHYATSYICWTQNIEGIAALFRITRDTRYAKLARDIAALTAYRPGEHAHGFLTSVRGIMDLYEATGDKTNLEIVERAWQSVEDSGNLLPTGGVPERWAPLNTRTEGCAEADWIRLNLALWRATNNSRYLLAAEKAIFNEFQMNHFCDGEFGHRVITETGISGEKAVRAWWCCSLHGLRCFPEIERHAFRTEGEGVYYDLPVSSSYSHEKLSIEAQSSLERDASVVLKITSASGAAETSIMVRHPEWAVSIELRLNGSVIAPKEQDGYLIASRSWKTGDVLELQYRPVIRREVKVADRRGSLFYGPWLLGLDRLDSEPYFNEETAQNVLIGSRADMVSAHASGTPPESGKSFEVPISHFPIGYRQAEYPMQPGITILRPVCEQTKMPSTDWEFRFLEE